MRSLAKFLRQALNLRVEGSIPSRLTNQVNKLQGKFRGSNLQGFGKPADFRPRNREWGDWHTRDDAETPRYQVLADLHRKFASRVPLLDLGCSTAPLLKCLPADLPYLGIDCQPDAVALAQAACHPHQRVICGDIADHTLHANFPFGCGVFSEVLYYQPSMKAALALLEDYAGFIQPPRIALITVWIHRTRAMPKNASVLDAIRARYGPDILESHWIPAVEGGWHVLVVRLRR